MIQQKSFRDRLPFPAASILIFLYLTFNIINRFINDIVYRREWFDGYYWNDFEPWYTTLSIDGWLWLVLLFTLAVLLLVKIPNVGITVTLGLIAALNMYWFVINTEYLSFYYFNINIATQIISIIALLLLTVHSISTYTNVSMSFCNAIWFMPGLLEFTNFTLLLINWATNGADVEYVLRYSLTTLFYSLLILFIGKWLADVSEIKHPDPNRVNETAYNFRAPQPSFVRPPVVPQPPVSPYVPQPPMPPMPRVPVAPVVTPAPQAPFVPQPAPDPMQELTKYKEMLDNGLITEDEYNAKKKQILNL